MEHGYDQAAQVREMLTARHFAQVQSWRDLAGIERVTGGGWPEASHEPWMNSGLCSMPDGSVVKGVRKCNIYKMNYDEIKKFDCGKRTDKKFPKQKSVPSYKPLLDDVFAEMEKFISINKFPEIKYCIEVKSFKILDGKY